MKFRFSAFTVLVSFFLLSFVTISAQQSGSQPNPNKTDNKSDGKTTAAKTVNITPAMKADELAKIAVEILGGDKFKSMKTLIVVGSVNLYAPNSTQSIPGSFVITNSGVKHRMEVKSLQSFTFIYDGEQMYSSMQRVRLPPQTKFGLSALQHLGETGYVLGEVPDKKKMRAFSLTDPEGNMTKYFVDPKTGRIKGFDIPYGNYTYGSEIDEYKEYDGILVPTKFVQRLDTQMGAFYAEFKAKEVKINSQIEDTVFAIPTK